MIKALGILDILGHFYILLDIMELDIMGLDIMGLDIPLCGTFQTKSTENWDDELTQSAHLCNPRLALYTAVGYTFCLFRARLRRKQLTFDPS